MSTGRKLLLGAASLALAATEFCGHEDPEKALTADIQVKLPPRVDKDPEGTTAPEALTELIRAWLEAQDLPESPIKIPQDAHGQVPKNYDVIQGIRDCVQSDPELSCVGISPALDSIMNCYSTTDSDTLPVTVAYNSYNRDETLVVKGLGLPTDYAIQTYSLPTLRDYYPFSETPVTPDMLLPTLLEACTEVKEAVHANLGWEDAQEYCSDEGISAQDCLKEKSDIDMDMTLLEQTNEVVADNLENLDIDFDFDGFKYEFVLEDGSPCESSTSAYAGRPEGRAVGFNRYFEDVQTVYLNCTGRWEGGSYTPEGDYSWLKMAIVEGLYSE